MAVWSIHTHTHIYTHTYVYTCTDIQGKSPLHGSVVPLEDRHMITLLLENGANIYDDIEKDEVRPTKAWFTTLFMHACICMHAHTCM
jgi:hypothetical protein